MGKMFYMFLIVLLLIGSVLCDKLSRKNTDIQYVVHLNREEPLQEKADIVFVALTIWREARGESRMAKEMVAQTIMNRMKYKSLYERDVMSVIFCDAQFSSMTNKRDKQLTIWPSLSDTSWRECLDVASRALSGGYAGLTTSTHFYDNSMSAPYWAKSSKMVFRIGNFIFHEV